MTLSSLQLEAFAAAARALHFSRAAKQLGLTQSALSQRIKNLEDELGLSLFSRGPSGVRLTETGTRLLRYCQTKDQLEAEILSDLVSGSQSELAGVLRVAGYSSVMRSVVIPALSPLLRANPKVQAHFVTREMRELQDILSHGEAEFVVLDHEIDRVGIETRKIGEETYSLIESSKHRDRDTTYLDHDPEDPVTRVFLKRSSAAKSQNAIRRSYLGDIYSVLEGVALGMGRAVAPKHLAAGLDGVRAVKGTPLERLPVVLHYHAQPVYPRLQRATLEALMANCPKGFA